MSKRDIMRTTIKQAGLTLLITLLLTSVTLAISAALLNVTLKQFQLSGIARNSEMAFQAANAGSECILYYDLSSGNGNTFDVPGDGSNHGGVNISCMGDSDTEGGRASGDEQNFQFDWGVASSPVCTDVSIYKFYDTSSDVPVIVGGETIRTDCPAGVECTVVQSRGYSKECSAIINSIRVVERELTYVY